MEMQSKPKMATECRNVRERVRGRENSWYFVHFEYLNSWLSIKSITKVRRNVMQMAWRNRRYKVYYMVQCGGSEGILGIAKLGKLVCRTKIPYICNEFNPMCATHRLHV